MRGFPGNNFHFISSYQITSWTILYTRPYTHARSQDTMRSRILHIVTLGFISVSPDHAGT
jgi:hypothetical protein